MSFVVSLMTAHPATPAAAQFGADAGSYQAVGARATAVRDRSGEAMEISAGSRAATETVNAVTVS
jgi:hypothetical protein